MSFLKDEKQSVFVNGHSSYWTEIVPGVFQGSVLGPLMYLVQINDLSKESGIGTIFFLLKTHLCLLLLKTWDKC